MSTVAFTQTDNGSAAVNITGKVVYGTEYHYNRLNHYILPVADGTDIVTDSGPTQIIGVIILKDISASDYATMLNWIEDDIIFAKNRFTIGALSGINWGVGDNTALTNARFHGKNTTSGVFEYMPPGIYTMTFPYHALLP